MARQTRGIGDKWIDVCRLLNSRDAEYIVVGGVAVNLHGHVRATKDLDILVPRDTENTKRILDALGELPYGMARELDAETVNNRPITIVGDDPRVDILKSAGSLNYKNAKGGVVTITIQGVAVPYAGLKDLIRSKKTKRHDDKADERRLQLIVKGKARRAAQTTATRPTNSVRGAESTGPAKKELPKDSGSKSRDAAIVQGEAAPTTHNRTPGGKGEATRHEAPPEIGGVELRRPSPELFSNAGIDHSKDTTTAGNEDTPVGGTPIAKQHDGKKPGTPGNNEPGGYDH